VDGGYFENYGAVSGKELALAVHAIDPSLSPLVIVVSNDPDDLLTSFEDVPRASNLSTQTKPASTQKKRARVLVSGSEPVTDLTSPLNTIANARTAHGLLGADELHSALRDVLPPSCDTPVIEIRVWPQLEEQSSGNSEQPNSRTSKQQNSAKSEKKNSGKSKEVSMSWWLSAPVQEHLHQQTEPQSPYDNSAQLAAILQEMSAPSACTAAQ
jgi:hypothetical protein